MMNEKRKEAFAKLLMAFEDLRTELDKEYFDKQSAHRLLKRAQNAAVELEGFMEEVGKEVEPLRESPLLDEDEFKNKRVLVVDDEEEIVMNIVRRLKKMGFQKVEQASNGRDAYNCCIAKFNDGGKFDLIISDWRMPKMDGLQFLQTVRNNILLRDTPFMFVTAVDERNSIDQAIDNSVDQYLVKPFKGLDFDRKVRQIMGSAQKKKAI